MTIQKLIQKASKQRGVLNVDLLEATAARIRANQKEFNQDANVICGSTYCIGGEVILAAGLDYDGLEELNRYRNPLDYAQWLLGLDEDAAASLFNYGGIDWPSRYRQRYKRAKTPRGRANTAADLLDAIAAGTVTL